MYNEKLFYYNYGMHAWDCLKGLLIIDCFKELLITCMRVHGSCRLEFLPLAIIRPPTIFSFKINLKLFRLIMHMHMSHCHIIIIHTITHSCINVGGI